MSLNVLCNIEKTLTYGCRECIIPVPYFSRVTIYFAVGRHLRAHISSVNILSISPSEFTLTCQITGAPATIVKWMKNRKILEEDGDNEASKVIVDTFSPIYDVVYESRLHVRGVEEGNYRCYITTLGGFGGYTIISSYRFKIQGWLSVHCICSCIHDCTQV